MSDPTQYPGSQETPAAQQYPPALQQQPGQPQPGQQYPPAQYPPAAYPTEQHLPAQYPPAQYPAAQYAPAQFPPAQYAANPYPVAPPTNVFAIIALVLGFVFPIGGIVLGHIALSQIKRTGEQGHGMALAGTIIGYALTILAVLGVVAYVVLLIFLFGVGAYSSSQYSNTVFQF